MKHLNREVNAVARILNKHGLDKSPGPDTLRLDILGLIRNERERLTGQLAEAHGEIRSLLARVHQLQQALADAGVRVPPPPQDATGFVATAFALHGVAV